MKTVTLPRDDIKAMVSKHKSTVTLPDNLDVKIGDTVLIKLQGGGLAGTARVSGFSRRTEGDKIIYYYSFNNLRVAI